MTDRESKAERKHRRIAVLAGWFVDKIMKTSLNSFPDRFYARALPQDVCRTCNRGRIVLIEWKRDGKDATPQQKLRHRQLRAAGVEVYVVDNIVDANSILGIDDADMPGSEL